MPQKPDEKMPAYARFLAHSIKNYGQIYQHSNQPSIIY